MCATLKANNYEELSFNIFQYELQKRRPSHYSVFDAHKSTSIHSNKQTIRRTTQRKRRKFQFFSRIEMIFSMIAAAAATKIGHNNTFSLNL